MKIEQSDVSLFSEHEKYHSLEEKESLNVWNSNEDAPERLRVDDKLEISKNTQQVNDSEMFDVNLDAKTMSILRALESLLGKKIDISFYREAQTKGLSEQGQERLGWGMEYSYEKTEISTEMLNFSAQGDVQTQDGKKIDFKLAFSMQKQSISHESISLKAGDALIDPLVLNFDGNNISISDIKHNFDLNLDGKKDEISFVGEGSGFLAIDNNKDGIINDGSELFGPTLGNGFDELKAYDEGNNGWIDENDAVFEKLLIWTKDANGDEELYSLKDKNIGALYLERVSTSFDLQDSNNNLQAKMRESSVFLKENGEAGIISELDLVI